MLFETLTTKTLNLALIWFQCSAGVGVCADDVQGGTYDIEDVTGSQVNGVTTVKFKRKLDTGDQKDKVYGGGAQFVIWALGNINMDSMLVTKHDIRLQGMVMKSGYLL